MDDATTRRLAVVVAGVLLAAAVTTLAQLLLLGERVIDAEPYAVAVGVGVSAPLFLAGAYPATNVDGSRRRATLLLAEALGGVAAGVGAVALLLVADVPELLPVGGGAAAAYVGATAARALVLGRIAADESPIAG